MSKSYLFSGKQTLRARSSTKMWIQPGGCLNRLSFLIALMMFPALSVFAAGQPVHNAHPRVPQRQVIGYFTEGGAKADKYTVKDLITSGAAARLTEINYAFGRVADNQCQIGDREAALSHAYSAAESIDGTADPADDNQLRGTF